MSEGTGRASDSTEINRARWDALASVHGQDGYYYDEAALLAGADALSDEARQGLALVAPGGLAGLEVLHLQCHIGHDTVSLARRGARVAGLDFSAAALERAATLAARAGLEIEWARAEATAPPESLRSRFDLVYASYGVLNWIGDVEAWMRTAAGALRGGGRLLLIDCHPLLNMVADDPPLEFETAYGFDGPHRYDEPGSYAAPGTELPENRSVEYQHSLGEIVTGAAHAGLRVETLIEHVEASAATREHVLTREADGMLRLRAGPGQEPLPILFTLIAARPGTPRQPELSGTST
jgi:SAM-dependent methyltransferase